MSKLCMFILVCVSAFLCGCKSEVDKCVDSQLLAWKDKTKLKNEIAAEKMKNGETKLSEFFELMPDRLESEVVAEARLSCLKAAK